MLYTLHRDAIAQQRTQSRRLSEHADSLAARNGELNYRLQELISHMDRLLQSPYQFFRFLFITVDSSVIAVYYDVGYEQQ